VKKILITFSGAGYESTTSKIVEGGPRFGADETYVFDDWWLRQQEFYEVNRWLWDHRSPRAMPVRGFGWYSWKPFLLMHMLDRMSEGDVVLYTDGDCYPIAPLNPIFDIASRDGAMFFAACGHSNHRWNTRDCLVTMGLDPEHLKAKRCESLMPDLVANPVQFRKAGVARFMAIQKGPWRPRQLLCEWIAYATNPMATTFEESVLGPEHAEFSEHRTEQAILTNLCHRHGYRLYREACGAGEVDPNDWELYGQLFVQEHQGGNPHPPTGSPFRRIP
jgi:hypothetical protein